MVSSMSSDNACPLSHTDERLREGGAHGAWPDTEQVRCLRVREAQVVVRDDDGPLSLGEQCEQTPGFHAVEQGSDVVGWRDRGARVEQS